MAIFFVFKTALQFACVAKLFKGYSLLNAYLCSELHLSVQEHPLEGGVVQDQLQWHQHVHMFRARQGEPVASFFARCGSDSQ